MHKKTRRIATSRRFVAAGLGSFAILALAIGPVFGLNGQPASARFASTDAIALHGALLAGDDDAEAAEGVDVTELDEAPATPEVDEATETAADAAAEAAEAAAEVKAEAQKAADKAAEQAAEKAAKAAEKAAKAAAKAGKSAQAPETDNDNETGDNTGDHQHEHGNQSEHDGGGSGD